MKKLGELLDTVPEFNRERKIRAIAIVTVGKNGELDVMRLGMSKEQFQNELVPMMAKWN